MNLLIFFGSKWQWKPSIFSLSGNKFRWKRHSFSLHQQMSNNFAVFVKWTKLVWDIKVLYQVQYPEKSNPQTAYSSTSKTHPCPTCKYYNPEVFHWKSMQAWPGKSCTYLLNFLRVPARNNLLFFLPQNTEAFTLMSFNRCWFHCRETTTEISGTLFLVNGSF